MKIAIFGKKYQVNTSTYREALHESLIKHGVKKRFIDETYYESTSDQDENAPEKVFHRIEKILSKADAVIIESTHHSDGIGLVSGLCIAYDKPTLILCDSYIRKIDKYSTISKGASLQKQKYWVREYTDNNFDKVISEFLNNVDKVIESKFFIILAPEIKRYLDWWSMKFRQPKVEKIRQLLLADMDENEEWKKINS